MAPYVIAGGGLAAAKAAETLRDEGFDGEIVLLGAEPERPYERPPLSKEFLLGKVAEEKLYLRYEDVIVITESGFENFTDFLPSELDEIEKLVGRGGMLQAFPPLR